MKIEIIQIALKEFDDARAFYEMEQSGLGLRFEYEIKQSLLRIKQYTRAWSSERKEIRRYFVHKFPFKIIYSIQKDILVVLAFAHFHRKPYYWVDRLK